MSNVVGKDHQSDEAISTWEEALSGPAGSVRLEFGIALNLTGEGGSMPTVTVHTKGANGRWKRHTPFLTPEEGGGRAELLHVVAALVPDGV